MATTHVRVSTDIFRMTVSHFATGNSSIARAQSIDDLDKAAGRFDLKAGDFLVLEAPEAVDLDGRDIHVTSGRALFFAEKTGECGIIFFFCVVRFLYGTLSKIQLPEV